MALTKERAEALAEYLNSDVDRAKRLATLPAEEAIAEMNKEGNDFTVEELQDFAEQMQPAAASQDAQGELGEDALNNVAGGFFISAGVAAAGAVAFAGAYWAATRNRRR